MITAHATAEDFARWEAMALSMDAASLHYAIKDCMMAAAAMSGWNPNREGYYMDQMATFAQERARRQGR